MSASSSAASSTLTRSRSALFVLGTLACAFGTYYVWTTVRDDEEQAVPPGTGLHRSNAVHRRRRRTNTDTLHDDRVDASTDLPLFLEGEQSGGGRMDPVSRALTDGETVVDDQAFQEEYSWSHAPQAYERNGQNIVQLLFRVSEDATRRNAYVHRGCECNSCGAVPIRGIRYHCVNCADYDLCEGCESQGLHIKTHIFYKIRVPAPSFGPILSLPVAYTGDPDSAMRVLPREITTKLSRETGFERPELDAYWEQWTFMANSDWRDDPDEICLAMDRITFEHCLVPSGGYRRVAPSLIFDRMFAFYDTNNDNLIGFSEFLHGIAYRKKKDKWTKIFEGYDIDGDGFVDRKDFLRMFRSYYVLYRQMHKDMLDGMQEQQMTTTEAHRLINGRQPLSSAFGTDGRYPRAPNLRAGEGKAVQANGDLEIQDGKGVLNESGNDTGNREDIFRRNPPQARNFWSNERERSGYWETMLNPPESLDQMPSVVRLNQIRNAVDDHLHGRNSNSNAHPALVVPRSANEDNDSSDDSDSEDVSISDSVNDQTWLPDFVTVTDEDAEAIDGPGTRLVDLRRSSRRSAIIHAVSRERAQQHVHERWKRRQFYTDEEEGGSAPANWTEDQDVLATRIANGESSKSQSRPSFHSRSSSKVRFAEDMDDFETRSNPSTSSRSVPERWGGIEIPDAEKDAGKEILFQVTQQAFNELLDPFFKEKEDAAVAAAARKHALEKYRDLYSTEAFQQWAEDKEAEHDAKSKDDTTTKINAHDVALSKQPIWSHLPEVEVEEVRERPLEELLAATGYSVDNTAATSPQDGPVNSELPSRHASEETRATGSDSDEHKSVEQPNDTSHTVTAEPIVPPASQLNNDMSTEGEHPPSLYRDPTMPQFRPNSTSSPAPLTPTQVLEDSSSLPGAPTAQPSTESGATPSSKTAKSSSEVDQPSQEKLYILWKLEKASKEAEKQGGWGRLSFVEFESKVKKFTKEGKGNHMDYLGSWIDFCIP